MIKKTIPFSPSHGDNQFKIKLNDIPISWDLKGGSFTFLGLDSALFWTDPSLLRTLLPLSDEIGNDLFRLLIAHSSSQGTEEDYTNIITTLGDNFIDGFLAWGKAVSGAGWGTFELPEYDFESSKATIIVKNPWELSMQRNLSMGKRWGCPFLQGKIIGIFNHAFSASCWAEDVCHYSENDSRVIFHVRPSNKTIEEELNKLRKKHMLAKESKLADEVKRKTRDLKLTLTMIEEYSKTLELRVSERTEELKKALELIEGEKHKLKALAETAPIGIGLVENERLQWVNEEMLVMFKSEMRQQYHEKALADFFPSEEVFIEFFQKIDSQLRAKKTADEDVALKRDDGSVFIGHIRLSCQDPLRPLDKAVVTVSDITWREQVAIERMKKEKLKGVIETSGAVCHELNQPLQSILGLAELIMMNIKEDDPHYGKMKKIKAQVERMGDITQKIMGITTYETMEYLDGKIIDINKASE